MNKRTTHRLVAMGIMVALASCGGATGGSTLERAAAPSTVATAPVTQARPSTTTSAPAATGPTTAGPTTTASTEPTVPNSASPSVGANASGDAVPAGIAPGSTAGETSTRWSVAPYLGSGAWVDVFDWTMEYTGGNPSVTTASIDRMAQLGVETLYLQTSRFDTALDITEPDRLQALIDRAHGNGMAVVAWYLPTMTDVETDVRRLLAAAALDVEGLSVNLESRAVEDVAERNRRMVEVSRRVDEALPGEPLATVILNPFALDVLAPRNWPDFPWAELDPYYEVWQPMLYVTYRRADDPYRDPYLYTQASMRHMRERYAPNEPIHPVTGIADQMTVGEVEGFVRAAREEGAIGAGIYDWATATEPMWAPLAGPWG